MVADLSQGVPASIKDEVKSLLADLGNPVAAIPFYALFPAGGGEPIVVGDSPLLQTTLIDNLDSALAPQQATSNSSAAIR